jgi:hypothetical protein
LLLQQDALHDRPGTAGAAPPGCVSTRRRPLRGGPSTHSTKRRTVQAAPTRGVDLRLLATFIAPIRKWPQLITPCVSRDHHTASLSKQRWCLQGVHKVMAARHAGPAISGQPASYRYRHER